MIRLRWAFPTLAAFILLSAPLHAQELAPRAYWPAPKGTKVAIFGYSYSSGGIITDPSIPVTEADSSLNSGLAAYLHTFSLAGRSANIILEIPYTWGTNRGEVQGQPAMREVSGFGDIAATLSVNLRGAPSLTPAEFGELRRNPRQILGASLKVVAPTGEYETDKVVNIGTNRWAVRTELGYMYPITPRWLLELEAGVWFFGDNNDFLGVTREQEPIVAGEVHLIRRIRPGFWVAFDLNYYRGGQTIVDGEVHGDLQENSRFGLDLLYTFQPAHALKFGCSKGIFTESGTDYTTVLVAYHYLLNRRKPAVPSGTVSPRTRDRSGAS